MLRCLGHVSWDACGEMGKRMDTIEEHIHGEEIAADRERDHGEREAEQFGDDQPASHQPTFMWSMACRRVACAYPGTAGEMFDGALGLSFWARAAFSCGAVRLCVAMVMD
jgi:hypothetical protein